jgi:predicted ribosomally synthesized peptide with SipW-like signal peptide
MKIKKSILGSAVAMVAAVGLIGGGTLAGWTATDTVEGNQITSGELLLNVSGGNIQISDMYPGREVERTFHLATATTSPEELVGALSVTLVPKNERNGLWDEADIQLQRFYPTGGQGCAAGAGTSPGFYNGQLSWAAGWGIPSNPKMQDLFVQNLGGVGGPTEICIRANTRLRFDRASDLSQDQVVDFDLQFDLVQLDPATNPTAP